MSLEEFALTAHPNGVDGFLEGLAEFFRVRKDCGVELEPEVCAMFADSMEELREHFAGQGTDLGAQATAVVKGINEGKVVRFLPAYRAKVHHVEGGAS